MAIPSSNILSCPDLQMGTGRYECTDTLTGNTVSYDACQVDSYDCVCNEVMVSTPCAAFADGFNYTTSILAAFFVAMLTIVVAVKLMRFAGEDG